jgi:hypothetical protein
MGNGAHAATVTLADWVGPSPKILAAEDEGLFLLMNMATGQYLSLDAIASDIWRRIAQPISVAALCESLVASYDGAPEVIEREVLALLEGWRAAGVVVCEEKGSP